MTNTRTKIAVPFIALASALLLAVAVATPAAAATTGARTQLCGGPLDAQVHIKTTGNTNLSIGKYGTSTYPYVINFPTGTNAYVDGMYQSYRWNTTASTISLATSTCI